MPLWLQAGLWGLFGGSSLLLGAGLAYLFAMPSRLVAGIMAFGCGVLISAVAYDLLMEGFQQGGLWPIAIGSLSGSIAYSIANWLVTRSGGKHRKRSGKRDEKPGGGSGGLAIAVGSLLDGIPESIVLGISLLSDGGVSIAMLTAVFLSNLPEGLSSAVGMKTAGKSARYVLTLWGGMALLLGAASLAGAALLGNAPPRLIALVNAIAAGALLTMIADTMIPEAVEGERGETGLLVVTGLLVAFTISQTGG